MTEFTQNIDKQLQRIGKEFQSVINRFVPGAKEGGLVKFYPAADVIEEEGVIKVLIDLPGLSKKDITLALTGSELRVEGARSISFGDETDFSQRERKSGYFSRSFSLPAEADEKSIKARFTNGVLQVTISKAENRKPKTSIPIE